MIFAVMLGVKLTFRTLAKILKLKDISALEE